MCVVVVAFSFGSTIVKKAAIPGPTLAFWRMVALVPVWTAILWWRERRFVTAGELRKALVPGVVFGLNLTCFFTGVTKTTVANAEFIGALTPIVLIPAGVLLFKDRIDRAALLWGVMSLGGLMLVLFNAPSKGNASWAGNGLVVLAMMCWATYILTSRRMRQGMSVASIMTSAMLIATLTILPIVVFTGNITKVTVHSVPYILALTLLTGTVAHGLVVFAQRSVAVGTISLMQVAQPALAAIWSVLFLSQTVRSIQILGMVLVVVGLIAVTAQTQRNSARVLFNEGELASSAG